MIPQKLKLNLKQILYKFRQFATKQAFTQVERMYTVSPQKAVARLMFITLRSLTQ